MDTLIFIFKIVRGIFIFIDIGLVALLIYTIVKSLPYRPQIAPPKTRKEKVLTIKKEESARIWNALKEKVESDMPDSRKVAIIEADKFVDGVLKRAGVAGEHMADRLDQLASDDLASLDQLWRAHRVRNELVHNPDFQINENLAKKAFSDYETFLREIGILD